MNRAMELTLEEPEVATPEFLDRHPRLPILFLLLLPLLLHLPLWLSGRSTAPIWPISGMAQSHPGVGGYAWLDPNVGFTSEALGRLGAWDWVHGIVPWWNEYTGVGVPLAGELQPGSFFLPFTFLFLLPDGFAWEQLCMQMIAGVGTYLLLRELGLSRLAALSGGVLFSLNGTLNWGPGPAGVYCGLPFLPWQLWGIELSRKHGRGAMSVLVFGGAIAWSILAGFPEPAYISGLLVLSWALLRFFTSVERWRMVRRAGAGFVLGLMVSAPMLIAFVDYVRESDSFGVHKLGENSLPWKGLAANLMPYVYGLIGNSYQSKVLKEIWDNIGGYGSLFVILLAVVGLTRGSRERGLKILLAAWSVLALAKGFGVQPVMGLMNLLPLIRQAAFYRYSPPSWDLALIVLAAFGLDEFRSATPRKRSAFGVVGGLLLLAIVLAWPAHAGWERPASREPLMFVFLGLMTAWVVAGLLLAWMAWTRMSGERRRIALTALLVVDAAVMFMVPQVSSFKAGGVDEAAVDFLHEHQGLSRVYALGRALQPNYGAYFKIAEINHNVLPVPRLWARYAEEHLEPRAMEGVMGVVFTPNVEGPGRAEESMNKDMHAFLDLGVRYVLTEPGETPAAKRFVPDTDAPPLQAISMKETLLAHAEPVFRWARSVTNDIGKPAIERSLAQSILKRSPTIVVGLNGEAEDGQHVYLEDGQKLSAEILAPEPVAGADSITGVGMTIASRSEDAQGQVDLKICAGHVCVSGTRLLAGLKRAVQMDIPLEQPLHAAAGTPLDLTLTFHNSRNFLALDTPASIDGIDEHLEGPQGAVTGKELLTTFDYGPPLGGARKVYTDVLMDIWELQNAAPYFEVTHGGPCTLEKTERELVIADCAAPATLRRRELYMQGWGASANGGKKFPVRQDGIFESTALAAGHSQTRFDFVPPHEGFGWAACFAGLAGFLWQIILLVRRRFEAA